MSFAALPLGKASVGPWVKDMDIEMIAVMVMEFATKTVVAAGRANNLEARGWNRGLKSSQ